MEDLIVIVKQLKELLRKNKIIFRLFKKIDVDVYVKDIQI